MAADPPPRPPVLKPEWFDHPSSIHSAAHVLRVAFWTLRLGAELRRAPAALLADPRPLDAALVDRAVGLAYRAALLHDLGRTHDGVCFEHGRRAAAAKRWVLAELGLEVDDADWAVVARAVAEHCTRDFPLAATLPDLALALLKDADGLDRCRIGLAADPSYLRLAFSAGLLPAADRLYRRAPQAADWDAVRSAAAELGLA